MSSDSQNHGDPDSVDPEEVQEHSKRKDLGALREQDTGDNALSGEGDTSIEQSRRRTSPRSYSEGCSSPVRPDASAAASMTSSGASASGSRGDSTTCSPGDSEDLDFGDPRKIGVTIILMPFLVFTINTACNKTSCTIFKVPRLTSDFGSFVDPVCFKLYVGWLVFHAIAYHVIPGKIVFGQPTPSGKKLMYRCNGFTVLLLVCLLYALAVLSGVRASTLYDRLFGLMTAATLCSLVLSVYMYHRAGTVPQTELSEYGNTGHTLYDFYLGRELNPRWGFLDLKYVCELRPGLLGWLVLDLVYLTKAVEEGGFVHTSQIVVTLCHFLYVIDALYFEESVLTTMDITREGFGFMLLFGDLVWVPFLFSLQTRFLLEHPQTWSTSAMVIVMGINYKYVLKAANGKSLLVSGWWRVCRHPNYLGDVIMSLAWALPCGFDHLLPWFYTIYLVGTLIHRSGRDDKHCSKKYGSTWTKYCQIVPYKIVPGVY